MPLSNVSWSSCNYRTPSPWHAKSLHFIASGPRLDDTENCARTTGIFGVGVVSRLFYLTSPAAARGLFSERKLFSQHQRFLQICSPIFMQHQIHDLQVSATPLLCCHSQAKNTLSLFLCFFSPFESSDTSPLSLRAAWKPDQFPYSPQGSECTV